MKSESRTCQSCGKEFVIDPDDFSFYKKIDVPPPTWCPECRMLRRFVWRNERHLFRHEGAKTGVKFLATLPSELKATVYDLDYWNSDAWDPLEYGRDYDFSRPFFEQFREFMYSVPWPGKSVLRMVNSEYCDQAGDYKNAYLCFSGAEVEDSAYVVQGWTIKNSMDLYQARHTELSYENYMADECYRVFFSVNVEECADVWFSKDMIGCTNCFGCVNLRNKSYHIWNRPYSKEDYAAYMAKLDLGSQRAVEELKNKARDFWSGFPVKYALVIKCVNSTGEHIEHSKNLKWCYSIHEGENMAYSQFVVPAAAENYDYTNWGWGSSLMYECTTCGEECNNVHFSWECWPGCRDLEYSAFCRSSEDCFGCVSLKKKQYCIFNKQYSKEDYLALRERIIAHMNEMPYKDTKGRVYQYGEFFPPDMSPFAYNETIAQDFFPLEPDEIKKRGYLWREPEVLEYETTMDAGALPDNIKDIKDHILKEIIKCADCGRAYRIIQPELQFYRHATLPLPRFCPNCRFKKRAGFMNPPRFWPGKCQCAGKTSVNGIYQNIDQTHPSHAPDKVCKNVFQTSYAPGRPEVVYCEECYQKEVI